MCSSALPHLKLQGYALPKVEIYVRGSASHPRHRSDLASEPMNVIKQLSVNQTEDGQTGKV